MAYAAPERLKRYQERSNPWLLVLALLFLVLWTLVLVGRDATSPAVQQALTATLALIWVLFVADIVTRSILSGRPLRFLVTHPTDLLVVIFPFAQPLKLLTVFASGAAFATKRGRVAVVRAVAISLVLLMWAGAAAVFSVERDAPNSTILTFGDALWWAPVTTFGVGYGDKIPSTTQGRMIAVVVMAFGIALISVVTASVAAWFLSTNRKGNADAPPEFSVEQAHFEARINALEAKIDALLLQRSGASPPDAGSDVAPKLHVSTEARSTSEPSADPGAVGFGVSGSRE